MKLRLLMPLCLLLSACGQAGPLYLPGEEPPRHGHSLRPDTHKPSDELPPLRTPLPTEATQDDKNKPKDAPAQPAATPVATTPAVAPDTSPTPPPVSP